jgi:N6-adenosine-specific RNA methylase IME4
MPPLPADPFLAQAADRSNARLEAIVTEIETLQATAILQVAARLAEARDIFHYRRDEGGFTGWVERRLSFGKSTAYKLLDVHERFGRGGGESFHNMETLPRAVLYLLAAPSTPDEARAEVVERVEAGERLRHVDVQAIIEAHGERRILQAASEIRAERSELRHAERIARLVAISGGNSPLPLQCQFPILCADPPYQYEHLPIGENRIVENHYPTMPLDEICALRVSELATDDALLFLWIPEPLLLSAAPRIFAAWGFEHRSGLVWDKQALGMGFYVRQEHEHLLIGTRGDMPTPLPANRPPSIIHAPRREHSRKPDEAYEVIERMYPGLPRIELFARGPARPGWAVWGNEALPQAAE